jgi:hypothetical protein
MAFSVSGLTSELQSDPIGYGYTSRINNGDDSGLADLLNLVRDGTNGGPSIVIRRSDIPSQSVWESIDVNDYTALPTNPNNSQLSIERRFLSWMEGLSNISKIRLLNDDGTNNQVFKNFGQMFPSGTPTFQRLTVLANRNGSRAEQLFGTNTFISITNIAQALGRG